MTTYYIALIPGDGIGKEVVPEGCRVLDRIASRFGLTFIFDEKDWSCERYAQKGAMMPEDGLDQLASADAIYLGAVGWPTVKDHISLWGLLIPIRRRFDQFANVRPVRLFDGVPSPLANRKPGDIDMLIVRENVEGEYSQIGGRLYEGTEREIVTQQSNFTRQGTDRIIKYAFEQAQKRTRKKVTSATKSNGITITMPYWDERFEAVSANYPASPPTNFTSIFSPHILCEILTGSMWSWAPTSLAISFPILDPPSPAPSASLQGPISIPTAASPLCSSPFTAPPRILPDRISPIPSAKSGPPP